MTWIQTVPRDKAGPEVRAQYDKLSSLFPKEYRGQVPALTRADGTTDSILTAHSLIPDVMFHIFSAYGRMLAPELPLSRRQHEMIATLVSSLNRCHY